MSSITESRLFRFLKILLLIVGIFSFQGTFAHEGGGDEAIIHMTERGFEPAILTITLGTEVIFENIGEEERWPASDDHPSHTLYDGTSMEEHCGRSSMTFDPCGGISTGKTWSFVFERTGTFGYHDHLSPHFVGTIVVKEVKENIFARFLGVFKKFFERLQKDSDKKTTVILKDGDTRNEFYLKLKERYRNTLSNKNPKETITLLEEESMRDERVYALCHDVLHEIGRTAYGKYGSFAEATTFQSDFCNSGYLHGVFEAYFESASDPEKTLAEECQSFASRSGRAFDLWQCYHGAGHGFMYFTAGDLDRSLILCKESFGKTLGVYCQNGAFMEVFNLEVLANEKGLLSSGNPLLVCSERESKGECYPYVAIYFHYAKKMPFSDIFDECSKAEFGRRDECVFGIGSEAMKRNMKNFDSVAELCLGAKSNDHREACLSGAVMMYILNSGGNMEGGLNLCAKMPDDYADECRKSVEELELFFKQILHFEKK